MKIALITLGCPKNLVDTEVMLGLLSRAGHEFTADPADAETVIVSTCSFIAAAVQESRDVVAQCLDLKSLGRVRHVVVAGCLPQRFGDRTWAMFPGVDGVVGCSDFPTIACVLREISEGGLPYRVNAPEVLYDHNSPRVLGTPAHLAYVKIAEGCDNLCAYCTIPSIRGALRSRTLESLVREVEGLAAGGVREVNLIAQDTTAYGTDIASDVTLPALLSALDDTCVQWIRVLYTHPAHVTDELLGAVATLDSVVPYLDMPIQHIADGVLERMGRRTDGERIRGIISRARETVPDIAIRSSVMTGFPGETEADFEELRAFVRAGNIDHLGVFEFSPEEGTPAFEFPDGVDPEVSSMRARALVEVMREVTEARGRAMVGRGTVVMIDSIDATGRIVEARTRGQAWEMDGVVIVDDGEQELTRGPRHQKPGELVRVTITGASGFDLTARLSAAAEVTRGGGETA
jgi:ribosomal protein S12 methylthiotransferase